MDETTWAAVGVFVGVLAIWVALVAPRLEKHRSNAIDLRNLLGPMRKANYAGDRLDRAEEIRALADYSGFGVRKQTDRVLQHWQAVRGTSIDGQLSQHPDLELEKLLDLLANKAR